MDSRYIVGIDLGTTNSAMGYVDLHDTAPGSLKILTFDIPQLVAQGRMAPRKSLPSFLYLPGEYDLPEGSTALPWDMERNYAVGTFARDHGALVPGRLVSSAKSWLCYSGVDRQSPILPWGSGDEIGKVSPVRASSLYLQHLREAWDDSMPEPFSKQKIILTVPASFDEDARELTLQAAKDAGLEQVTLIEEPLAAFYAWLSSHETDWPSTLEKGELILVADVGGGTTDLTLISFSSGSEAPSLERIAVGDHLLLGGDNMDLILTEMAEKKLGKELDPQRWQTLFHQCRQAKEAIFSEDGPEEAVIRLAGTGKSIIGGTMLTRIDRESATDSLMSTFFPEVTLKEVETPHQSSHKIKSTGLPYAKDLAVTRHLAHFISRQAGEKLPSAVLFNGGALKPDIIRNRMVSVLESWSGSSVKTLESNSLDLAISLGAAYYGLSRQGLGLKIGGGIPRAYYVGVEMETPHALCLLEKGTEEGEDVEIMKPFKALTNRPVKFSLYSSTIRKGDKAGDIIEVGNDLLPLPPIQTVLHYGKKGKGKGINVRLGAKVTPIGTLELYCESLESPHKWRLQFQLRKTEEALEARGHVDGVRVVHKEEGREKAISPEDEQALVHVRDLIAGCFSQDAPKEAVSPTELPQALTEAIGMRKELWSLPLIRGISDTLIGLKNARGLSREHEARWFNLTGFCLRPGSGDVMDPWRIKKLWPFFFEGLVFPRDPSTRLQWWIFWRRIAAGLGAGQQTQFFSKVSPVLLPARTKRAKTKKKNIIKVSPEERREMWLFASNLERLSPEQKTDMGRIILKEAEKKSRWKGWLWCLSRLGARYLLYGPANKVVSPGEITSWLKILRKFDQMPKAQTVSAIINMTRLTGDRTRDIPALVRENISEWLKEFRAKDEQLVPLKEVVEVKSAEKEQAFGEGLPEGLTLK